MKEIIWTNASGKNRRQSLEFHFQNREIPDRLWAIRLQDERGDTLLLGSSPDLLWLETEEAALRYAQENLKPHPSDPWSDSWDLSRWTVQKREKGKHLKDFPRMIEEANYLAGFPPEARLKPVTMRSANYLYKPGDLIDPITGLVPVYLILARHPAGA